MHPWATKRDDNVAGGCMAESTGDKKGEWCCGRARRAEEDGEWNGGRWLDGAEFFEVGAVAGVEEYSCESQADREAEPYPVNAKSGLEAKIVGGRDGYDVVADESRVHDRLDILDSSQHICEA